MFGRHKKTAMIAALMVFIVGCADLDSIYDNNGNTNDIVVNAGTDIFTNPKTETILSGTASGADNVYWAQIKGPSVIIENRDTSMATFITDDITCTIYTFAFTGYDNKGYARIDVVAVIVGEYGGFPCVSPGNT